jgi:predicted nucleic acid-binding protein
MLIALDTNILAYAEGINDANRQKTTIEILRLIPRDNIIVPVQCLGELFNVMATKAKRKPDEIHGSIIQWEKTYKTANSTFSALFNASILVERHKFQIWDALILAVAAENRCSFLLSEDMQHGYTYADTTIINPYSLHEKELLHRLAAPSLD